MSIPAACPSCDRTDMHAAGCPELGRRVRQVVAWTAGLLVVGLVIGVLVLGPASSWSAIIGILASPMGAGLIIGLAVALWWARR